MPVRDWLEKKGRVWHKRFIPSLVAGIAIALITIFFKMTTTNVVLFASLGASAAVITHKQLHRLSILRTVLLSYGVALFLSLIVLAIGRWLGLSFAIQVLVVVTLVTIGIYLFGIFHPSAISASLAFLVFEGTGWELVAMLASVLVLLVLIKLLTYAFYFGHIDWKKFRDEFKKWKHDEEQFFHHW